MTEFSAASQTSSSAKIVSYHCVVNEPSGMVGNRSELNEKMIDITIGAKTKTKTSASHAISAHATSRPLTGSPFCDRRARSR